MISRSTSSAVSPRVGLKKLLSSGTCFSVGVDLFLHIAGLPPSNLNTYFCFKPENGVFLSKLVALL